MNRIIAVAFILLLTWSIVWSQEATLTPTDTMTLRIARPLAHSIGIVRFNVSTIPANAQIDKAYLILNPSCVTTGDGPGMVTVLMLPSTWAAVRTPSPAQEVLLQRLPIEGRTFPCHTTVTIDIVDNVRGWLAGGSNNGIAIGSGDPDNGEIYLDLSSGARIEVQYSIPGAESE